MWKNLSQGKGQSAVVIGEAGIGKSRLAFELRRLVSEEGALTRTCRCLPEYRNNALYPILKMLQDHWGISDIQDSKETHQRLKPILEPCDVPLEIALPILCSWLSLPLPDSMEPLQHSPERQKQIFLDVLEELIVTMSQNTPFLLIIEDLHWMDPTSLEFCERLVNQVMSHRILLVRTARPEFIVPWETPEGSLVNLQRLTPSATEQLIQEVAGNVPVEPKTLDYLVQRTDGVPLFVEELLRMLLEDKVLVLQNGQHVLESSFDVNLIPVTLKDLLSGALERLGISKETAQVAAAIGREFNYQLLVKSSFRGEADVQHDLDVILAAGLAYRQRRIQSESYIFKHALVRDAAYDSMFRPDRKQIHARIAETLEAHFPEVIQTTPGTVAQHHAGAEQFEQAIDYGTRATRNLLERSLNDEALVNVNQGMEWLKKLGASHPDKELVLNEMETQALIAQHGWAAVIVKERMERARELYNSLENSQPIDLFPTLWSLSLYNYAAVHREEMKQTTEELFTVAQISEDTGIHAATALMRALYFYSGGTIPSWLEH